MTSSLRFLYSSYSLSSSHHSILFRSSPQAVLWSAARSFSTAPTKKSTSPSRKIKKIMSCNRGEIAIRLFRAGVELGLKTVGVYAHEDRFSLHRYKADESYLIGEGKSPVGAYLDYPSIVKLAVEKDVDAIHPGYGFLSENANFAQACYDAGIHFVGPPPDVLRLFGDKTEARKLAIQCGVPIVPGTPGPIATLEEANEFVEGSGGCGYPVIVKAAHGGGGRGMRVVRKREDLAEAIERCSSEALTAFGNGTLFIERFVERPRHIEIQVLADGQGNAVHLFERDCSVQRRHQKVIEIAPAAGIPADVRQKLWDLSIKMAKECRYKNAGTVEFLLDPKGQFYFIEVNPRIQVEHTVTEEVTGIDIVQSQIKIADGKSLPEIGLVQKDISLRGCAIQCRVTTENPRNNFTPDYGRIEAFRPGEGMGLRLDSAAGFAGALITPFYDSLLIKVTSHALNFQLAADKLARALREFRVRGVHTNIPFALNVLRHPVFLDQKCATDFIDIHPELFKFPALKDRGNKLLKYLAEVKVNGHPMPGADPTKPPSELHPHIPVVNHSKPPPDGFKQVIDKYGPAGFASAVRKHPYILLGDTTWRDAHQSLLATRVRTIDMAAIAPATARTLPGLYALEMWGGATFDVAMRFLRECPWERLDHLRKLVPNIPFQMLLRGANAVGYTSYPDNLVYEFCKTARQSGIDIFRVFDSLNYVDNLLLGMDAVHKADGVVQGEICYTGDVKDAPTNSKYTLDYYLGVADALINKGGTHVLGIKDMAGLLTPASATHLIGALRKEFPDTPIHVHTHDTGGIAVASMIACANAGADAVHGAIDAMSGTTSQPSLGALTHSLYQIQNVKREDIVDVNGIKIPPLDIEKMLELHDYWEIARNYYLPFEQSAKSTSSDVIHHEMPGGQYTNLMFQSQSLGLAKQWREVKHAYAEANLLLGDIVKVTPSSKVVGDLAQFMVANGYTKSYVEEHAGELNLPTSVVEFLQGQLGQPVGGFPEPFRSQILSHAGLDPIDGRPGEGMAPINFEALEQELKKKYHSHISQHGVVLSKRDVLSAALYPKVFDEYIKFRSEYSDSVTLIPTPQFLHPMNVGDEMTLSIENGKMLIIKFLSMSNHIDDKGFREVIFSLNGVPRSVKVVDKAEVAKLNKAVVEKVDHSNLGHVGASMPGSVAELRVKIGQVVEVGDPVVVLSAMKMETIVAAPMSGKVERILIEAGATVHPDDLLAVITPM